MPTDQYLHLGLGALALGYFLFLGLLFYLPRKLRSENQSQRQKLIAKATEKAKMAAEKEFDRQTQKLAMAADDLETEIEEKSSDLETLQGELVSRQEFLENEEKRLERVERETKNLQDKLQRARQSYDSNIQNLESTKSDLKQKLATKATADADKMKNNILTDIVEKRQIECTKRIKILEDELNSSISKHAQRMLARTLARYSPGFIWPKGVSHVEIPDDKFADQIEASTLVAELSELTEDVTITLVREKPQDKPIIRLAGGYGIFKEAAKLGLEEMFKVGASSLPKVAEYYGKQRQALEAEALKLGKRALVELNIDKMHVEILKMVGALNWRTSYRQNQYFHSMEVAKLAGILATELGVDVEGAKRCGLLHDIGKSIDYRIEGSHAVISGDYADRFGENKTICDTVMSHHSDLIVETPLADVLRSADTLSGARPGARVNLEEGYQDRLSSIQDVVRAFPGVMKVEIMNGAREVHVEVHHSKVKESDLSGLSSSIARKIEEDVAFPGQIKILVSRRFESVAVA